MIWKYESPKDHCYFAQNGPISFKGCHRQIRILFDYFDSTAILCARLYDEGPDAISTLALSLSRENFPLGHTGLRASIQ